MGSSYGYNWAYCRRSRIREFRVSQLPDPSKQPKIEDKPTTSETVKGSAGVAEDPADVADTAVVSMEEDHGNPSTAVAGGPELKNKEANNHVTGELEDVNGQSALAGSPGQRGAASDAAAAATANSKSATESDGGVIGELSCAK